MEKEIIRVGIASYGICRAPNQIMTVGLGSCVGVVLYSLFDDVCGLAHIMLPQEPEKEEKERKKHPARYADTGLRTMIEELEQLGVRKEALKAKISGGACMPDLPHPTENSLIGKRNVEAVKKVLSEYGIEIEGNDVGGAKSRTIIFDSVSHVLTVRLTGSITYQV